MSLRRLVNSLFGESRRWRSASNATGIPWVERSRDGRTRIRPSEANSVGARVLGLVPVVFAGLARPLLGPGGQLAGPEHDRVPAVDPDRERLDLVSIVEPPFDLQRVIHVDRREVLLGPPPRRRELDAVVRAVRRGQRDFDTLVEMRIPFHGGHGPFDRHQMLQRFRVHRMQGDTGPDRGHEGERENRVHSVRHSAPPLRSTFGAGLRLLERSSKSEWEDNLRDEPPYDTPHRTCRVMVTIRPGRASRSNLRLTRGPKRGSPSRPTSPSERLPCPGAAGRTRRSKSLRRRLSCVGRGRLLIREAQGPYLDRADASDELPSESQSGPYSTLSRHAQVGNTGLTSQALPRPVRRFRMSGRRTRRSPDRNGHTEPAEV